jgi:hypothetical protein
MKRNWPFSCLLLVVVTAGLLFLPACNSMPEESSRRAADYPGEFTLTTDELMDRIKGGWAGQVIGCTYGGPTEFKFNGTMIQEYTPIPWDESRMAWYYEHAPGLYDDIYMDLTFVEVFEREGLDAPASSHAHAFAHAGYALWHANQSARYNILQGMTPPETGHWENNPHADDIDFQIEADFAGLMNPGMVNSASEVCDRVGHIMNYGDGWYGGVYVAAMYALSFVSDDIGFIVSEALKTIPAESQFHRCIADVIRWHREYPDDWRSAWFETEKKWSSDIGCPDGVFEAFNIDAKVNAAYIVIGLLYGEGDFGKTIDISTRCGQDSDCNPASAGGILGIRLGYSSIPGNWKAGLDRVEDQDFKYTTISLNDAYRMSFGHALEMIGRNGGSQDGKQVTIRVEEPLPVRLEQALEGHFPTGRTGGGILLQSGGETEHSFEFSGKGFVIRGGARRDEGMEEKHLVLEVAIDDQQAWETVLPTSFRERKNDVAWKYNLPDSEHRVRIRWMNPEPGYGVHIQSALIYGPEPAGTVNR